MTSPFLGEFLGTMILILLEMAWWPGAAEASKAEGSGWMVITAGWAFAVMAGVFVAVACGSSDAHLNPAVTLGFAVRAGSFGKCLPYVAAQLLGAMAGATLVLGALPAALERDAGRRIEAGVFCTGPRYGMRRPT